MILELIRYILEYVNDPNDMMLLQDNYSSILHHKSLYKHGCLHYENDLNRSVVGEIC